MDLVHNAIADSGQCLVGEACPVGGHRVFRGHGPDRADATVGPVISHDANCANGQEDSEVLPDLRAIVQHIDLFAHHGIGLPQELEILPRDLANNAYGETRTRERLPVDNLWGQPEGAPNIANFVLEEIA